MTNHTTTESTNYKTCTQCGETKPGTTEYYSRHKSSRDGLRNQCKECVAEYKRAKSEAEKRRVAAWCEANKEHIAERERAWREDKRVENIRAFIEANKDKIVSAYDDYREANRERIAEYSRAWRARNKERISEYERKWRKDNPGSARASTQRRRALIKKAEGTHTAEDIKAQYKAQRGRCYYCDANVSKDYHVDHVIPLSRGGSNGPENLVITCPDCNLAKSDKLPHEWIEGGRLL